MTALLIGGPFAGRCLAIPDLAPVLVFPMMHNARFFEEGSPLDFAPMEKAEYALNSDPPRRIGGHDVVGYRFRGEDKYATARTLERVVAFGSPYSLQELDDKALIEALIRGLI